MDSFGRRGRDGRRTDAREASPLTITFSTVTQSHCAILVDVSATGARLRGRDLPPPGRLVEFKADTMAFFGLVRWAGRDECGVVFEQPLAAIKVKALRRKVELLADVPPEIRAAYEDWMLGIAR